MSEPLPVLAAPVRIQLVVERSRFVCDLVPVTDETAAAAALAERRREFHDARHHCSALVLGVDGEIVRSSDDGEPSGTAGAPMLAALTGAGISDVLAVVTRYFGGILLGSGGLVRAYGSAVAGALVEARRLPRRRVQLITVRAPLAEGGRVESLLRNRFGDTAVEDVDWGADGWTAVLALPAGLGGPDALTEPLLGVAHEAAVVGEAIRPV